MSMVQEALLNTAIEEYPLTALHKALVEIKRQDKVYDALAIIRSECGEYFGRYFDATGWPMKPAAEPISDLPICPLCHQGECDCFL